MNEGHRVSGFVLANPELTTMQAIAIAAAIFAARDLAKLNDLSDRRAQRVIEEAISKARYIIDVIEHKLQ